MALLAFFGTRERFGTPNEDNKLKLANMIELWIPDVQLFLFTFVSFNVLFYLATTDWTLHMTAYLVLYIVTAGYFFVTTMRNAVYAIRYINPRWNKVDLGSILWPRVLYKYGLKEYDNPAFLEEKPEWEFGDNEED